jgi:hypothetical protein
MFDSCQLLVYSLKAAFDTDQFTASSLGREQSSNLLSELGYIARSTSDDFGWQRARKLGAGEKTRAENQPYLAAVPV